MVGDTVEGGTLVAQSDLIEPGGMAMLQVNLQPGEYILTCPVSGHIQLGMHTEVAAKVSVD